jgi:hypothetical protein
VTGRPHPLRAAGTTRGPALTIGALCADKGRMLLRIAKIVTGLGFAAALAAFFGWRH